MDSRFSTMVIRASASVLMSSTMARLAGLSSSLFIRTEAEPEMAVRGVRRSWDTARSRLLWMASRAASSWMAAFSSFRRVFISYSSLVFCSRRAASMACFFTREVRADTTQEMDTMLSMATG